jgi:hypothetical protein
MARDAARPDPIPGAPVRTGFDIRRILAVVLVVTTAVLLGVILFMWP